MKLPVGILLAAIATHPAIAQESTAIKRVFESSAFSTTIVIETAAAATIKCAVYDKDKNPLRVETQPVTPPLDEIQVLTGDATSQVASAECWKMQ